MKKILIFGTGFIATNLVQYFKLKDKEIECCIIYNKHKLDDELNVKQYSISDDIEKIFSIEKPDSIIMLLGNSVVSDNTKIYESVNDNVLKSSNFLEVLYEKKLYKNISKILLVGSASEYGKFYDKPIKENFNLHPTSIYGLSKILLFKVFEYFVERGMPIVYIRQFNTIGIGQRDKFVFPSFIKDIIKMEKNEKEAILNVGDLEQERDFIDVRDSCRAYDLLIQKGNIGEVYNVASGSYVKIKYLLEKVIDKSTLNINEIKINTNPNLFSKEESLSKRLHADINKIIDLGFKVNYRLEDTIEDSLEYGRKNVQ